MHAQFVAQPPKRLQGHGGSARLGTDCQRQRVHHQVLFFNSIFRRLGNDFFCDGDSSPGRVRDAVLVEQECHHYSPVLSNKREHAVHRLLLSADRIDHCLPVINAKRGLHRFHVHGVNLQRQAGNALQAFHGLFHHLRLVDARKPHVHVEDVRPLVLLHDGFL